MKFEFLGNLYFETSSNASLYSWTPREWNELLPVSANFPNAQIVDRLHLQSLLVTGSKNSFLSSSIKRLLVLLCLLLFCGTSPTMAQSISGYIADAYTSELLPGVITEHSMIGYPWF